MVNNGLGTRWLLLRGLARETAHWDDFPILLQRYFPMATIHTLDLPGTGYLYRQDSPRRIEAITDNVRQQALEQKMLGEQPLTLLAYSLGGMVAWDWLQRYPTDLNGAVLLNTSFANLSPFYQRLRWQSYPQFLGVCLETNMAKREAAILKLVSNRTDADRLIAKKWTAIQQQRPVSLKNSFNQIVAAATYRPISKKPLQPVLLLSSQKDRLVSSSCSLAIQKRWQIELATHPWAGHDLCLDQPLWVVDRIKRWVEDFSVRHQNFINL
jgi:pimeloyl-[acyl-carrier protein] methyl ester esterase